METPSAADDERPYGLNIKFDKCSKDLLFKRTPRKLIEAVYKTFQQSRQIEKSSPSDVYSTFGTKTWTLRTHGGTVKIESVSGSFERKETGNCDVSVSSDERTLKFCLPQSPPYVLISLVAEKPACPFFMAVNSSGFQGPGLVLKMSDVRCLECSASEKYVSCHITALPCATADEVECFFHYLMPRVPETLPLAATKQEKEQPKLCNRLTEELKNERASRQAAEAQYQKMVQLIGSAHYELPKTVDAHVNTDPDPTAAEAKELRKQVKQLSEQLRQANGRCAEAERRRQEASDGQQHAITELAAFRNAYQDLSNKNHDLDEQVTHLKAVNKEQKNKLRAFDHTITQEKKDSKGDGSKKRSRQTSLDPMQTEMERIRRDNDDLKATERSLQKKNLSLERNLAAESKRVNELTRKLESAQRKTDELVATANKQEAALVHKVDVLQQDNRRLAEMLADSPLRAAQLQRAQEMNAELREELRRTVQRATSARIKADLLEKESEGHTDEVHDLQCKVAQLEEELKKTAQRASSSQIQGALLLSELDERDNQLEEANQVIEQLRGSIALSELQQRATSAEVRAILLESTHRKEIEDAKQRAERLEAKLLARNDLIAELSIKLRDLSGASGGPTKHEKNDPTETPV